LQEEERQFRALVGGLEPGKFFVVQGKTPEEVLTRDAALREALRSRGGELVDSALSLSQFVPPVAAQERSLTAVKTKLNPNSILPALEELGLSGERYFVKLQQQPLNPLTVEEWVRHPFSAPFRALWLNQGEPGQGQGQKQKQGQPGYSALVLLLGVKDSAALRHFEREGVYYVDQLGEAATLLKRYRLEAGWFVAVCYFLVFLLLVYRYGVRRGATAMVPAVLAVGVNLGVQGVLGQPVNLFTLLANLIVLGLAIDYAVFLLEGAKPPTMMAILLSAVSTVLSFGLLALSQTAVLQFFGTSLFFGVIVAMVLAPMVIHDEQGR
jgi:predicted exporter